MPRPAQRPDPTQVGHLAEGEDVEGHLFDRVEERTEATLERGLEAFERAAQTRSRSAARVLFPLAWLVAGALTLLLLHPAEPWRMWTFTTVYFAPLGLETGIPYGLGVGLDPWLMITIVLWVDLWGGLFLVWNLALLHRVPKVGPWLRRVEAKSAVRWERHERLRNLGIFGLALFVFLPVSGSGAVPAAVIGRIGGFPWALVWLAIFVGSAVRVVSYTYALVGLGELLF